MKLVSVSCLCGSDECRVLYERPYSRELSADDFNATTDRFDGYGRIVKCRSCGLAFTNPRPEEGTVMGGYADSHDPDYQQESSSRSINAHLSLATVRRFAAGGRLLELGCATGFFLNAARADFEVEGVEPSRWAAQEARRRFGLQVHAGTLQDARLAPGSFDALAMIDVIEHLTMPAEVVADCGRLLKPGGFLYLVTPDIDSLSAKILRGGWWALRPAHLYYFGRGTLSRLLERAGFEVALVRSFGRIFTWGYWSSRLKNYPWVVRRPVDALVGGLGMEDKVLYLNTRDSLELVARKKA